MHLNFLVNRVYDGWTPYDKRLGGTEESVVEWSKELAKRGHKVRIYQNGFNGTYADCIYLSRDSYKGGGNICINVKSPDVASKEPTLYLTNETNASTLDLSGYTGIIWPSQWAVDNIPVNNKTFVLPHGYNPKNIYPGKKIPKQCFYASSPDRGLDTLLEAWPSVREVHPDATLLLTYGAPQIDLPGVINMGEVDDKTMDEIYRTSEYWCHPANGGELYCMTGVKAQVADCWPVIIPTMALAETVRYGTFSTKENYSNDLIKALNKSHNIPGFIYPTWETSTDQLLQIIQSVV